MASIDMCDTINIYICISCNKQRISTNSNNIFYLSSSCFSIAPTSLINIQYCSRFSLLLAVTRGRPPVRDVVAIIQLELLIVVVKITNDMEINEKKNERKNYKNHII